MKKKIKDYIQKWRNYGYNEIPDEIPIRISQLKLAPSFKDIAICILNNDHQLKKLGFSAKKSYWYDELKKIELIDKGKIKKTKQLKLKL